MGIEQTGMGDSVAGSKLGPWIALLAFVGVILVATQCGGPAADDTPAPAPSATSAAR